MSPVPCPSRCHPHPSVGLRCPHICHLTFAICHLTCSSQKRSSKFKRQKANVAGPLSKPLPSSPVCRIKVPPHLPFDLCHLPFDLLVPEKKFKIQTAKGKWQMFRVPPNLKSKIVLAPSPRSLVPSPFLYYLAESL